VTYVENCADCFADAVERPEAAGGTFNVVDAGGVRAWRFARAHRGSPGAERVRVPVPYVAGLAAARAAEALSRLAFGPGGRLPSLLVPRRFEARFKPLRHSSASARAVLGWRPAVDYDEAVRRCR
jgi:nucleoside-diphosphate-sugar epimerase